MKISKVICPVCNEGGFNAETRKCIKCGNLLTDEIVQSELNKAWENHIRTERKVILIQNIENDEKMLLPFNIYKEKGIPSGFRKRSMTIPYPEKYWNEVKDLPIYKESL